MTHRSIPGNSLAAKALRVRFRERIENGTLALPLLSASAVRVVELSQGEGTEAAELAHAVRTDPALTAHVLQLVNSAAYAPAEPIFSIEQAISRMGLAKLAAIAVAVVCKADVFRSDKHGEEIERLWLHSSLAGAWAGEIARMQRRNVEAAFLAGLLHDVGRPVSLEALDCFEESTKCDLEPDLKQDWLEEIHAPVGKRLLEQWKFPPEIVDAVAHHHCPEAAGSATELAHIVHLADRCAHWSLADDRSQPYEALLRDPSVAALHLYRDEIDELLAIADQIQIQAEAMI